MLAPHLTASPTADSARGCRRFHDVGPVKRDLTAYVALKVGRETAEGMRNGIQSEKLFAQLD